MEFSRQMVYNAYNAVEKIIKLNIKNFFKIKKQQMQTKIKPDKITGIPVLNSTT